MTDLVDELKNTIKGYAGEQCLPWELVEKQIDALVAHITAERDALQEALSPFAAATLTHTGQIIGLMTEDFERARAIDGRSNYLKDAK